MTLDWFAVFTYFCQNLVNPDFIDYPHSLCWNAQLYKPIFWIHPKSVGLYVWRKSTSGFVVRVWNVIPRNRLLTSYHANSCHFHPPLDASDFRQVSQQGFLLKQICVVWKNQARFIPKQRINIKLLKTVFAKNNRISHKLVLTYFLMPRKINSSDKRTLPFLC